MKPCTGSFVILTEWHGDGSRRLAEIKAIYEANGEFFLVFSLTQLQSEQLAAQSTSGLQLTLDTRTLNDMRTIRLFALAEIGLTALHRIIDSASSVTFTLVA